MPTPQRSYSPQRKSFRFSSAYSSARGRNEEGKPEIPGSEKPLLFTLALLMISMPWLAGMEGRGPSFASLAIAVGCFLLGLSTRSERRNTSHAGGRSGIVRLIRFPVFYAGLALLAWISTQGLNPAVGITVQEGRVALEPIRAGEGLLPSATPLPAEEGEPLDFLLLFGTPFLAVCAIWAGISRRRSLVFLCRILCANGVLLAGLGLIQTFLGAEKILWMIDGSENSFFFSSFEHRIHAASYFNLILGMTAGMALFSYYESRRRIERSSASGVFLSFAIVLYIATIFTFSLGGFLAGTVIVSSLAAAFIYPLFIERETDARRTAFFVLTPLIILLITYLSIGTIFDPMSRHFNPAPAALAHHEVIEDPAEPAAGFFPNKWPANAFSIPVELGAAGTALLILILGFMAWQLGRFRAWRHPLAACILLPLFVILLPGVADPLLGSPVLLTSWCLFLTLALVLLRTERLPRKKKSEV